MSVWIPSTVSNVLVHDHLRMQLEHPELFSKKFPPTSCWFVVGRLGLRKHEAVCQAIVSAGLDCRGYTGDVSVEDEKHPLTMEFVRNVARDCSRIGQAAVIILNRGHLLSTSRCPGVTEEFNHWPLMMQEHPGVILVICSDVPLRDLPQTTKVCYQYQQQIFFPSPDEAWRAAFLRDSFTEYAKLIEGSRVQVSVPKDADLDALIEILVESSPYATIDEMEGYVNKVVRSVHKLDKDPIVLNEEYCCRYLVDKGGVYNMSEADGYAQEQAFITSAGIKGIPPMPERTTKTITDAKIYENGGIPPAAAAPQQQPQQSNPNMVSWGERITFDEKGKVVVLTNDLNKDVEEPERKRPKAKGKKRRH
jgi:hypothetical protein